MPIYEYQCQGCGKRIEVLQKVSDPPLTECPECHQQTLSKLVSAAAFQLKGTGWYVTDFRDKGKPAAKEGAGDKGGEGSGAGAAKSEASKPAEGEPAGGKSEAKKASGGGGSGAAS